jgi:DNA-binding transcriptional ArsR family regulator
LTAHRRRSILNRMVHYKSDPALDATFAALADATRRAMVVRLGSEGELAASVLGQPFRMSLPGVLKHVAVLADAGLVRRDKRGRTVFVSLEARRLAEAREWLETTERFWSDRLDALTQYVESTPWPSPLSSSAATSKRRSKPSSAPGPRRKR